MTFQKDERRMNPNDLQGVYLLELSRREGVTLGCCAGTRIKDTQIILGIPNGDEELRERWTRLIREYKSDIKHVFDILPDSWCVMEPFYNEDD